MHLRSVELRDKLWQISDDRKAEADTVIGAISNDMWVVDHVKMLEDVCIAALQAEIDRYTRTKSIITDYYTEVASDDPIIAEIANEAEEWTLRRVPADPAEADPAESEEGSTDLCPNMFAAYTNAKLLQQPPQAELDAKGQIVEPDVAPVHAANILSDEMQAALDCEDAIFSTRTRQLLDRCRALVTEVKELESATLARLDGWLGDRFRAEVGSVKSLWGYIANAIETEQELHYRLELLSEDFIVDEDSLLAVLPEPKQRPPEVESAHEFTFTADQLEALRAQIASMASDSLSAPVADCLSLLEALCASSEHVPTSWVGLSGADLQKKLNLDGEVVDLVALLDLVSGLSRPSCD